MSEYKPRRAEFIPPSRVKELQLDESGNVESVVLEQIGSIKVDGKTYIPYDISNPVVREYVDACNALGEPVVLYVSPKTAERIQEMLSYKPIEAPLNADAVRRIVHEEIAEILDDTLIGAWE